MSVRLTEFSHGAGCGCKISPAILEQILHTGFESLVDPNLLVGNETKDDAAVYQINDEVSIISTTDFFMPIVDDPFQFGRIAATNALSDVFAMGGRPIMAIAILGWPVDRLPPDVAAQVVDGGRQACKDAGIILAGGHSIDAPEPIFGLAVTGQIKTTDIKANHTAQVGDQLFLTKPLGVGILTTAQKKKMLSKDDEKLVIETMCSMNTAGYELSHLQGVHAMTDVTGFGLAGHLLEMCEGAKLSANIMGEQLPLLNNVSHYLKQDCIPGGAHRNWQSYGAKVTVSNSQTQTIISDPQTSGGLLIAVSPGCVDEVKSIAFRLNQPLHYIGDLVEQETKPHINVAS